jgi:hypothetical protein
MPDTISSLLGAAAAPLTLAYNGHALTARLIKQGVKSEWERGLREEAAAAILPLLGMDPRAFDRASKRLAEAGALGKFAFDGKTSLAVMKTPAGFLRLVQLVFSCDQETAQAVVEERTAETLDVLEQVLIESFPRRAALLREVIAANKAKRKEEKGGRDETPPAAAPAPEGPPQVVDWRYVYAQLRARGLTGDRIAEMTDREIFDQWLWPRDPETGQLVPPAHEGRGQPIPDRFDSPEEEQAVTASLLRAFGVRAEKVAEIERKLREKHGAGAADPAPGGH